MDLVRLIEKLEKRGTDRVRRVMRLANSEACQLNHEYIGTEHLLLAILREGGGIAVKVLKSRGVTISDIRNQVTTLVRSGPDMETLGKLPHTPRAMMGCKYARYEAVAHKSKFIGTEHLLLGLLREREGVACQVLTKLGHRLDEVEQELRDALRVDFEGRIQDNTPSS